jgi:hypothetical protein
MNTWLILSVPLSESRGNGIINDADQPPEDRHQCKIKDLEPDYTKKCFLPVK